MSINFKTTVAFVICPFVVFHSWNLGCYFGRVIIAGFVPEAEVLPVYPVSAVLPDHFGWYAAGILLSLVNILFIVFASVCRFFACSFCRREHDLQDTGQLRLF